MLSLRYTPSMYYGVVNKSTISNYFIKTYTVLIYQDKYFQRADLAVADITITREREKDADFTLPFLDLGNKYFCLDFIKYKTSYIK